MARSNSSLRIGTGFVRSHPTNPHTDLDLYLDWGAATIRPLVACGRAAISTPDSRRKETTPSSGFQEHALVGLVGGDLVLRLVGRTGAVAVPIPVAIAVGRAGAVGPAAGGDTVEDGADERGIHLLEHLDGPDEVPLVGHATGGDHEG